VLEINNLTGRFNMDLLQENLMFLNNYFWEVLENKVEGEEIPEYGIIYEVLWEINFSMLNKEDIEFINNSEINWDYYENFVYNFLTSNSRESLSVDSIISNLITNKKIYC
jgi:hypothetical protein